MRDITRAGVQPDPDLLYRALPYAFDPEWTAGHRFTLEYAIEEDASGPGGQWFLNVDDGMVTTTSLAPAAVDSHLRMSHETWLGLVRGELQPNEAMRQGLVRVQGAMYPVTLVGRWIERSEGRDDAELERERRQSRVQSRRATWGSRLNGDAREGQGDPAVDHARRKGGQLMSYEDLYALWERQNWRAHEIDFSVDKQHWLTTPAESQLDTMWSLASFYIGEERVAADLAPFVLAAPTGEIEIFLATQLVDEARHAAFFDRFMAEVMALEPEDIRGRLASMEELMLPAWRTVFDDHLRGISRRIQERPDDLDLFVEGIVTYHVVIEGVLAMTGQHQILEYLANHDIYPGFREGFALVERDEHRHIAFGVRFLAEACEREPRYRQLITDKLAELVPVASQIFVPPGIEDPSDFMSLRLPLVRDLRLRLPRAEAADGGGRRGGPARGRADAGADRQSRGRDACLGQPGPGTPARCGSRPGRPSARASRCRSCASDCACLRQPSPSPPRPLRLAWRWPSRGRERATWPYTASRCGPT